MDWTNFNLNIFVENISKDTLDDSQKNSLRALSSQLRNNGAIVADEVGTGKTRIACALIKYVTEEQDGRIAVIIPRGLIKQWQRELKFFTDNQPIIIINYRNLIDSFKELTTTRRPVFISQTFKFPIVRGGTKDEWKYLFLSVLLYLKKENRSFDDYRKFAKTRADQFIRNYSKENGTTESHLIKWAYYFIKNGHLFHKQTLETISKNYDFNFGDESSYHAGMLGRELMVNEVIGNMFGFFDLVIIDEAHKSKGESSTLNNILKMITPKEESSGPQRFLGLTATPIELHEDQWLQLLKRIKVDDEKCNELKKMINDYSNAFQAMTTLENFSEDTFISFKLNSIKFENNLGEFVTRRKKIIDENYLKKAEIDKDKLHPHRDYREEIINFNDLGRDDKKWVFLHECLSKSAKGLSLKNKISSNSSDSDESSDLYEGIKRLDSYFSRGHKKNVDLGKVFSDENKNKVNDKFKFERAKFFAEKWINSDQDLFKHPRIRKAIHVIEKYTDKNEKILVFGSFSGPIKTIDICLNARFILRSIRDKKVVRIPKDFFITHKDICEFEASNLEIKLPSKSILEDNEKNYESKRKEIGKIVDINLREISGLNQLDSETEKIVQKKKQLITARATDEIIFSDNEKDYDDIIKSLLAELAIDEKGVIENDEVKSDKKVEIDDEMSIKSIISSIDDKALSGSEYSMLLDGSTDFLRRSIIQAEFNRKGGFPRVLIAQSQVGKEGLNLHKACSVILLFNADWNPGVIEQQIGRVDRLNSLWEEKKDRWLESTTSANRPVLEIIELHFDGTYDQHQWEKLKQRKQTLLYHLYNSVDTENVWTEEDESRILKCMPDFSPEKYLDRKGLNK